MKNHFLLLLILGLNIVTCKHHLNAQMTDVKVWKLGWRMMASSMDENFELAELQFDTLLQQRDVIEIEFLKNGLEALEKLDKRDKLIRILNTQNKAVLQDICGSEEFIYKRKKLSACKDLTKEKTSNPTLQLELIKMYINDQYVRLGSSDELLEKYNLKESEVIINKFGVDSLGIETDEYNKTRLIDIIAEYGFPTKKLVGVDGMEAVFYIIQHASKDKIWQEQQLINIKKAVEKGDMNRQDYAYLYDRVKFLNGGKQLYGTQFIHVNKETRIVTLAETEDLENLDNRRMEIGMMPIEMYKNIILKND